MIKNNLYIDIDFSQKRKYLHRICGDVFLYKKVKEDNSIICVLSDGLGSGVKANVLATMTASMAIQYALQQRDIKKTAEIIMKTLPTDSVRKISYATFTIIEINPDGICKIVEYDNPQVQIFRDKNPLFLEKSIIEGTLNRKRKYKLLISNFELKQNDKLIFFSDGVSQSGMGCPGFPIGWGEKKVSDFISHLLSKFENLSARALCHEVVEHAVANWNYQTKDDITCAVINVRNPRKMLIVTGPPTEKENDSLLNDTIENFDGFRAVCGGTTAKIVSRVSGRKVLVDLKSLDKSIPCMSRMDGIDLVTEGMITLGRVLELLENGADRDDLKKINGATALVNALISCDSIKFLVGTKINDAHQDPNLPAELGIRRTTIKSIVKLLDEKYLKEVEISYI